MKLPLEIVHNDLGEFVGVFDADGIRRSLSSLVDYANSHAAVPATGLNTNVLRLCLANLAEQHPDVANLALQLCNEVDQLRAENVAVPGPPREDGTWDVLDDRDYEHTVSRRLEVRGVVYWTSPYRDISESRIVAHRKHVPLEVPHG